MVVQDIKKISGCLEGSNVWDYLLDSTITKRLIDHLGTQGKLIYHEQMDKPFFTVIVRGKYTIKGSEGNKSFRVILPENANMELLDEIKILIANYHQ